MPNLRTRLPPLGSLAAFEAAARLGSFTRAAAELNLTQAAVSRQIRALEQHLGLALFERRRHDVGLTPEGERYARSVAPAVNAIGEATVAIRETGRGADRLVIHSEISLAAFWLVPRLSRFQARYPELEIKLLTSNRQMDAESEPFDVALQYGPAAKSRYLTSRICGDEIIVACSPGIRATLPADCGAGDLAKASLIHLEQPWRHWITWAEFLSRFGVALEGAPSRLLFNAYNSAIDAAIEGNGLVLGWRLIVEKAMTEGKLVRVGTLSLPSPDDLCAHRPRNRRGSLPAQRFIDWLKAEVGSV